MFGREHIFCERADTKITCCFEFGPNSTVRFNMLGNQAGGFWHQHAGDSHYEHAFPPSLPVVFAPVLCTDGTYLPGLRRQAKAAPEAPPALVAAGQLPAKAHPKPRQVKAPPKPKAAVPVVPPVTAAPAAVPAVVAPVMTDQQVARQQPIFQPMPVHQKPKPAMPPHPAMPTRPVPKRPCRVATR